MATPPADPVTSALALSIALHRLQIDSEDAKKRVAARSRPPISNGDAQRVRREIDELAGDVRYATRTLEDLNGRCRAVEDTEKMIIDAHDSIVSDDSRESEILNVQKIRRNCWVCLNDTSKFHRPEQLEGLHNLPTINGPAEDGFLQASTSGRSLPHIQKLMADSTGQTSWSVSEMLARIEYFSEQMKHFDNIQQQLNASRELAAARQDIIRDRDTTIETSLRDVHGDQERIVEATKLAKDKAKLASQLQTVLAGKKAEIAILETELETLRSRAMPRQRYLSVSPSGRPDKIPRREFGQNDDDDDDDDDDNDESLGSSIERMGAQGILGRAPQERESRLPPLNMDSIINGPVPAGIVRRPLLGSRPKAAATPNRTGSNLTDTTPATRSRKPKYSIPQMPEAAEVVVSMEDVTSILTVGYDPLSTGNPRFIEIFGPHLIQHRTTPGFKNLNAKVRNNAKCVNCRLWGGEIENMTNQYHACSYCIQHSLLCIRNGPTSKLVCPLPAHQRVGVSNEENIDYWVKSQ